MDDSDLADDGWTPVASRGFMGDVGPFLTRTLPGGEVRYAMRVEERHLNAAGIVHGGAIMTFLDHALGTHGARAHDAPGQATMSLTVSFVEGVVAPALLEADVEVVRAARSVLFLRGSARVDGRIVATADGVWKLRRPRA
ncbi:thioesterase [Stappia sp. 22II-S9-Z10]|nr:thioesterase [Stappia sp. 22II-S9-Z10]